MTLVDEQKKIIGEEIYQAGRPLAWFALGKMPGIIFNAIAKPDFTQHFQIVFGAHTNALGFKQQVFLFKCGNSFLKLMFD